MQLKEFNILLDIKKYKKIEYIEVVKGDADTNVFNIQLLYDSGNYDLTGLKTEIVFSKPDGTTVLQDEENGVSIINNTEGKIQCTLKTNTIASGGRVMAEVRVLSVIDSRLLTSTRFEFFVRDSIVNDETIVSTNEFPILNQLISTTEGLIQQVELIEAQVPEQVVTDLNAVSLLANQLSLDLVAHKADIVQTTEVNSSVKYPSSAVTYALQQGVNSKASKIEGLTTTSIVIQTNYYNITLVIAGVSTDMGMFILSRGNVITIKNSIKASVAQAVDGKTTITSVDGASNISYLVIQ